MAGEPLPGRRRLLRAAVLFPIGAGGGTFALWTMSMIPTVADRLGWPRLLAAFAIGLFVLGPVRLLCETLANRMLALLGLPELRSTVARRGQTSEPGSPAGREDVSG